MVSLPLGVLAQDTPQPPPPETPPTEKPAPQKTEEKPAETKPAETKAVPVVSGITFAEPLYSKENTLFVPVRAAADALGWTVTAEGRNAFINGKPLKSESARQLLTGAWIVPVRDLQEMGATVAFSGETKTTTVSAKGKSFLLETGAKRVEVDLAKQELHAFQGDFLVLNTPVSTGRSGFRTPPGSFKAGPYKNRMHYSSQYNNAPMPWSVQVNGGIFFHGYSSVPPYPASHGCIRLPLDGGNPAKWLWHWIDRGTPVKIAGSWNGKR
jgi:lipoprotein-anchoring transpeptidase ErfK/SrfK